MWWLSFADPKKPKGKQFLGACIVQALTFMEALQVAHILKINPGGECRGSQFQPGRKVPAKWTERLLTLKECGQFDAEFPV